MIVRKMSDRALIDTHSRTSTPDSLDGERNSDTGFFDSSFASFYYSQNLSIGKLEMANQTFSPGGGPSSSAESLTTASSSQTPSSMSTLTSDSPLSSLGTTTSDESRKKDEILSGVNWNYGQHIGTSKRLRIRLRQVQEGLIRAKQYNIVKERLDLLLSVMSARKALGNPLSPKEIPTDLYNIIFHPQNI